MQDFLVMDAVVHKQEDINITKHWQLHCFFKKAFFAFAEGNLLEVYNID